MFTLPVRYLWATRCLRYRWCARRAALTPLVEVWPGDVQDIYQDDTGTIRTRIMGHKNTQINTAGYALTHIWVYCGIPQSLTLSGAHEIFNLVVGSYRTLNFILCFDSARYLLFRGLSPGRRHTVVLQCWWLERRPPVFIPVSCWRIPLLLLALWSGQVL